MTKYKAVIGSSFGDEAKGMTVARIAQEHKNEKILNVRFNGGAQAGHTVEFENKRHVFKTFGASTFFNSETYLSEDFIFNPLFFYDEKMKLKNLGYTPKVKMSKKAIFQIPLDAILNMTVEEVRDKDRHGSVGIGIFETVKRVERSQDFISFYDFMTNCPDKIKWFEDIIHNYLPLRLSELGLTQEDLMKNGDFLFSQLNIIDTLRTFLTVFDLIEFVEFDEIKNDYDVIIFEGAQGLLLDQNNRFYFPHLTPSNCGIRNISKMLETDDELEIHYATRTYLTRHGAGKMNFEVPKHLLKEKIEDPTNIPNDWQESLRFGVLNIDELINRIENDLISPVKRLKLTPYYSVSCLDHIPPEGIYIVYKGFCEKVKEDSLISMLEDSGLLVKYKSYSSSL